MKALLLFCLAALAGSPVRGAESARPEMQQIILSIAPNWDAVHGRLQLFERTKGGWQAVGTPWPVLYGPTGIAWGRGVFGQEEPGLHKTERDKRAPAGLFQVGKIYTYNQALPEGADYPFRTLTEADAWVDDPTLPQYNRHVVIPDLQNPPPWFAKQKMRHGDFAYRWLIEVRHNSDPPVPGGGSAIFFHLRRSPTRPSAGCTVMAEENLLRMIRWLREQRHPHYALLPRAEYLQKWKAWGLPSPEEAAALLKPTE